MSRSAAIDRRPGAAARGVLAAVLAISCAAITRAADETLPVVTSDLLQMRTVPWIDVAPDGARAVVTVRSIGALDKADDAAPDTPPRYEYRSNLYLVDLGDAPGGRPPRQLTFGSRSDAVPVFSPDGRRIAFLRSPGDDEPPQVWLLRADGGEAWPLASLEHGVSSVIWSPDGSRLLVSSSLPIDTLEGAPPYPQERPNRTWADAEKDGVTPRPDGTRDEIRAWLEQNAEARDPVVITRLDFQDEQALADPPSFTHLFMLDPNDPAATPRRLTSGFFDHRSAAFTPDGRHIVYAAKKQTERHPDRVMGTDLWRISVDGRDDRQILAREGWSFGNPRPSADGEVIAFLGRELDEPAFRQTRLGLVAVHTRGTEGEPLWLTGHETHDSSVWDFQWDRARSSLLFVSARQGGFPLMTINGGLLEPAPFLDRLEGRLAGVEAFDAGGGSVVSAVTTVANPCVLVARDGHGERVVWDVNPWVAKRELSMPVEGWVSRPDGTSVQYWVMEPTRREARKKYPVVLEMHGGPSAMWGPGELTMWHEFQLLCSWGYGVVYCNPRGSGGYGYEFQRANFQDWGEGPAGDVLAVMDHVAQTTDWIDTGRLVVTGGSYAGYLTAWVVAHDNRFKAAVAQRGVYDLATFFGEGNAWRLVEWAFGGWPFDARYRAVIQRNSPFTYVQRIRTPLLIVHASQDLRAGVIQSEMLYRALKVLDRPVEYVRYPDTGHELSRSGDPAQRMDRLNRIIEFFERHVDNPRKAPVGK